MRPHLRLFAAVVWACVSTAHATSNDKIDRLVLFQQRIRDVRTGDANILGEASTPKKYHTARRILNAAPEKLCKDTNL